jgi:uncharacterized protein
MIHKYIFRDRPIVIDVNSGAVHLVSPIIYDLLDFYNGNKNRPDPAGLKSLEKTYATAELHEAMAEIDDLIKGGMLFTSDDAPANIAEGRQPVIKALCLHVAHDCNMACRYCFGGQGQFSGPRALMTDEIGKKALDFLIDNSGSRKNLEVDFFGGEPLLNWQTIKNIVKYGREIETMHGKHFRFTLTTNGLLLTDEVADFLNRHMDNVILSIDGRPEVNDRMRPLIGGQGSHARVLDNFKRFVKQRDGLYYVRGTFTRHNLDFANDVRYLAEAGFRSISVEPVVAPEDEDYALRCQDLTAILTEYDHLADFWLEQRAHGKPFDFFHFKIDLDQGSCIFKRIAGCGAGTEYVAISPEGDIYPCHQFVGETEFKLGSLNHPPFSNHLFDLFNKAHVYNKAPCQNCFARFYCSGGCHANAWHANKDIMLPYELGCDMQRKRVECAIGIATMVATENETPPTGPVPA